MDFQSDILKLLKKSKILTQLQSEISLEKPPQPELGDYALPCFKFSKILKKAPQEIAKQISAELRPSGAIKEIRATGPYVNFFIDQENLAASVLKEAIKKGYGSSNKGKGKKIVIEYSSPNIAKPFSVGHLRSTIIGDSLYRCHDFLGYKCTRINYLGDWGTQFGKFIIALKKWGDTDLIEKDPIKEALKLYVKFHEEAEKDPSLEDEARAWFKKIEDGNPQAVKLWKWFKEMSLKEFKKMYSVLGVDFDIYSGESETSKKSISEIVKGNLKTGIAKEGENNSIIIDLEKYNLGIAVLIKSDGATLYLTRDTATAKERWKKFKFDKMLYVVGSEQEMHFRQLFKSLELMGDEWAKKCTHISFGLVTLPEGKMSTRKGRVVFLEDVIAKAINIVEDIVKQKNPDLPSNERKEIAKSVGIGAIKFADLSHNRTKNIEFDWNRMLDFEGDTGPYVQYAYARTCRILEKAGKQKSKKLATPKMDEERKLISKLGEFPDVVAKATENYHPHEIANYLLDLCHLFSGFYTNCPVINADTEELRALRLEIVKAVNNTLKNGLHLLGMDAIERM